MSFRAHAPRPLAIVSVILALALGLLVGARPAHASTIVVTTCTDNVAGSLRTALTSAVNGDVIDVRGVGCPQINLTSGQLIISADVTILGPGSSALTINGLSADRVILVNGSHTVSMSGLKIKDGTASLTGGGINTGGFLTIDDCIFDSNDATSTGAGSANGGAIFATAGMTITDSTFTGNSVTISAGGIGLGGAIAAGGVGNVSITNTTFDSNSVASSAALSASGGAIYSERPLTLADTVFTSNTATAGTSGGTSRGGAVSASGGLIVTGTSTFTDNAAHASANVAEGGAIYASGSTTVLIEGTSTWTTNSAVVTTGLVGFGGNTGGDALGGAIDINGATLTMSGTSTFTGNFVEAGDGVTGVTGNGGYAWGGAFYGTAGSSASLLGSTTIQNSTATGGDATGAGLAGSASGGAAHSDGRLTLGDGAIIANNTARGGAGPAPTRAVSAGGVAIARGGSITGTTFTGNTARGSGCLTACTSGAVGGGLYNFGSAADATVTVANSTFTGNSVVAIAPSSNATGARGGGVFATSYSRSVIVNSTVTGNTAAYGGGIYLQDSPNSFSLLNSTIAGNTASTASGGSGLYYRAGNVVGTFANTIFADNSAAGKDCVVSAANKLDANTSNLIEDGDPNCTSTATGLVTGDPQLAALASNGGTTQTMAIGATSAALLAADSATCQASPVSALDQRGVARPVGRCDIGAYQRSVALAPDPGTGGGSGSGSSASASPSTSSTTATTADSATTTASSPAATTGQMNLTKLYRVIAFDPGSSKLDERDRQRLRDLLARSRAGIKIAGYAPAGASSRLPLQRALSVARGVRTLQPQAVIQADAGAAVNRRCRRVEQNCAVVRIWVQEAR